MLHPDSQSIAQEGIPKFQQDGVVWILNSRDGGGQGGDLGPDRDGIVRAGDDAELYERDHHIRVDPDNNAHHYHLPFLLPQIEGISILNN